MLETVRAYAALELTTAGERNDALEGLARYCIGSSRAAKGLIRPAQGEWLIACVTIWKITAAHLRGSLTLAGPAGRRTSRWG